MKEISCPGCNGNFGQIALHWNRSTCSWPQFSDEQMETLSGLLLGDADIRPGTNGSIFRIRMTNNPFITWLDECLGILSRGVYLEESGEDKRSVIGELKGTSQQSVFQDLYGLRTVTHPQVDSLRSWYSSGKKRFPDRISERMLMYWYICDGWLNNGSSIRIRCLQQTDQADKITNMLENIGYITISSYDTDCGIIRVNAASSREFFDRHQPPDGFKYKWPKRSL